MAFDAHDIALQLISTLRAPVALLQRTDRSLADQIRRAASSVALNLAEGRRRVGRDRLHLFRVAAGSAAEVHSALQVALAWGQLEQEALGPAMDLLDRLQAMCWRLTHGRT